MRSLVKIFFWVMLLTIFSLMPQGVYAQKQTPAPSPAPVKKEKPSPVPGLADLMLQANELANRLAALKTKIAPGLDLNAVEKSLQEIEAGVDRYQPLIERLKLSQTFDPNKIFDYKDTLRGNEEDLEDVTEPVTRAIRKLGTARKQWLAERQRWQMWQSDLLTDQVLEEVKTTLAGTQKTIDSALLLISQELQPLLALFQKSGSIDRNINRLIADLDGLTQAQRRAPLVDETAPMLSWTYVSQLKNLTWFDVARGAKAIVWPEPDFYKHQGWILVLAIFTALAVIFMIFRHREQLMEFERWRFLAKRPIAGGFVLGFTPFYPLMTVMPPFIFFLILAVWGLAFVRLLGGLIGEFWKRLLLYAAVFFIILIRFFHFINLPLPLIQLYIFLAALVGLGLCYWRAVVSTREDSPLITWLFRLGCLFFLVVSVAALAGNSIFAEYLFRSGVRTVGWIFLAWLFIYVACTGVEGVVHSALLQKVALVREHAQGIIRQLARFVKLLISGVALAMILMVWQVYESPRAAIAGIWWWGVTIGSLKITVGHLLTAAAFFYVAFVLSWVLQTLVMEGKTTKEKMGPGGQQSVATLIHYAMVFVGFLLALGVLGVDLTQITILLGALGVGIGFGLQQIVNNLVSGIMLLLERPIRVGDYLELSDGTWAAVKKIGVRATQVLTFDNADVWIPNGDLISRQVINWTFSNRFARLKIPVGVAYGSDTAQVLDILMEVANEDKAVVQYPAPSAFFKAFGNSSLDFELRVNILDIDNYFSVHGRLLQEIERRLREAGIEIPFPQRDLHLRSVEPEILDTVATVEPIVPKAAANPSEKEATG